MDLKEDHSRQTRGEAEQEAVGDQEEPLYHNEGLVPQEVSQEEDREKEGEVGVRPDREEVVGHLWGTTILIQAFCFRHAYLTDNQNKAVGLVMEKCVCTLNL